MASKPPDEDFIGSTQDVARWPGERNQKWGCFRLPCAASTNARASKGFASKIELGVPHMSRPPWRPLAPACLPELYFRLHWTTTVPALIPIIPRWLAGQSLRP